MQGVVGNVVLLDESDHLLARPVEQWIDLDQAMMGSDDGERGTDDVGPSQPAKPLDELVETDPGRDVIEIFPTYDESAYRIEMWGDEVETLAQIDPLLGQVKQTYQRLPIYPKTHYVMSNLTKEAAIESIKA